MNRPDIGRLFADARRHVQSALSDAQLAAALGKKSSARVHLSRADRAIAALRVGLRGRGGAR